MDPKLLFSGGYSTTRDEVMSEAKNHLADRTRHSIIEITLSHPRTAPFKRMSNEQQRDFYKKHWDTILEENECITDSCFYYERSGDSHLHLHGSLHIRIKGVYFIEGLVQQICKSYFRCLPKTYCTYRTDDYHPMYDRYKSPMITAQYTEIEDFKRTSAWDKYIRKSQPIV